MKTRVILLDLLSHQVLREWFWQEGAVNVRRVQDTAWGFASLSEKKMGQRQQGGKGPVTEGFK